jgi:hypothetical protein
MLENEKKIFKGIRLQHIYFGTTQRLIFLGEKMNLEVPHN